MGLLSLSDLFRFSVYSGFGLDRFSVYSGFSIQDYKVCLIYSGFGFTQGSVQTGFRFTQCSIQTGFRFTQGSVQTGLLRVRVRQVYSGFGLDRFTQFSVWTGFRLTQGSVQTGLLRVRFRQVSLQFYLYRIPFVSSSIYTGLTLACFLFVLQIYEGSSSAGIQLAFYCGITLPSPVVAKTGTMFVMFKSDVTVRKTGFSAIFSDSSGRHTVGGWLVWFVYGV